MRYQIKILQKASLGLAVVALVLAGLAPVAAAAGSATLYLSPSSSTVKNGSDLVLGVYVNSGSEPINAVQANLTYSTSQLSFISYSSSSAFNIEAENPSGNSGTLRFARGSITPRTGAQLVVTVTLRAVASSGTAAVNFAADSSVSAADGMGTNILSSTTGGQYVLAPSTSPPPPPPPGGGTTPPPAPSASPSAPSGSSLPNPSDKTPPTISNVKASVTPTQSVIVTWNTSEPATSQVSYGEEPAYKIQASDTNLVTAHEITISNDVLRAGKTYYFNVRSVDASGNAAQSPDMTFIASAIGSGSQSSRRISVGNLSGITKAVVGVGASVAALAVAVAILHTVKQRRLARTELKRHFPFSGSGNRGGTNIPVQPPPPQGPTIINPTSKQ